MCGIFAVVQQGTFSKNDKKTMNNHFQMIKYRGPDHTSSVILKYNEYSIFLGFHRLAITDTSKVSDNLLSDNGVYIICNGEIYNYEYLSKKYNLIRKTGSDCEVILQLYRSVPELWPNILQELDGVFSFVLFDNNKGLIYVSRDRFGVRPLFIGKDDNSISFASEGKAIPHTTAEQFLPGVFQSFSLNGDFEINTFKWHIQSPYFNIPLNSSKVIIKELFIEAVRKRLNADRPIGFLVSGGLDSSLVAAVAQAILGKQITTFSIGLQGSPDLIAAAKVSAFLKSNHHEIIISTTDIINALPKVIYHNESYDITTTRASIPMYLLTKYISENTDIKVIFSGEGSDELLGGYLYFHNAPSFNDLQNETIRLLKELYKTDVLRSDRMISGAGLEGRFPFLDASFTSFISGLDPSFKFPTKEKLEKHLLRSAFQGYLPDEILWRKKEAFSDGVGSDSVKSLKDYAQKTVLIDLSNHVSNKAQPFTFESQLYFNIFLEHYKHKIGLYNDYYWMPKWSNESSDPSATVLNVYNKQ